ncbi:MAG: DUF87 domain-containing protein [Oscillospiraceae bacterium]|jgi:hypothetical protein|nr:DUF87 domain-containing protein [Oscillospiraceae bacterium]
MGLQHYTKWDYEVFPHLLCLGNSGSGKSYFLRQLVARISLNIPDAKAWICDYKNEFMRPREDARFYGYKSVLDGFNDYISLFEERLHNNENRLDDTQHEFRLLLIDEYISWLNSLEKKEAEEIKKRMANLLFMARSLNMHIVLGCQRGMAESFPFGSRDCLNVIFLGSPSRESIHSFCSSDEAAMMEPCEQGAGYIVFDGKPPAAITVPTVKDMGRLHALLADIVTR